MIARIWTGEVPLEKSSAYLDLMLNVALPSYRSCEGNRGAWCMRRNLGGFAQFQMMSFWDDLEAIRAFAGDRVEQARYFDFDADFLVRMDPCVSHFELF